MGYQTDRDENCKASIASLSGETEDEYGDPINPPICNWKATSTYTDECTVCGAVASYW